MSERVVVTDTTHITWVKGETNQIGHSSTGKKVLVLDGKHGSADLTRKFLERGWSIWRSSEPLVDTHGLDLIVCFGYRHVIPRDLVHSGVPIVNLHISYLPYNRGAHPGFWCFYDGTPCGVSVHVVDSGLDTGPLLARRLVPLQPEVVTFDEAYWRLWTEVQDLFWTVLDDYLGHRLIPQQQCGLGSFHRAADLPSAFGGWHQLIAPEIVRLHRILDLQTEEALLLIDEIERVRSSNNVNWMNILRLAFSKAPDETRSIFRLINEDDARIGTLLRELGDVSGSQSVVGEDS